MKKKIIIYGDPHGCLKEFKELRAKINPKDNDREIVIGDILDRGENSNDLLAFIREKKIESILGNHEYKYVRYKKHYDTYLETNKKIPMKLNEKELEIFKSFSKEDLKYLESLPFFIKIDNLTLVHAGITNKINLNTEKQKELSKLLWIRNLTESQNVVSLNDDNVKYKHWSEYYDGNQGIIVYGHEPFDKVKINKNSIGIDTGCVYGNKLTALIIDNTTNPMENFRIIEVNSLIR